MSAANHLSSAYKRYLLILLMVILAFNFVDRLILGIALEDIKSELALSDTQLGFLSGLAFTIFYSVMGIPIARWADRGNRITIIGVTTALWSAAVALCGAAGNYIHLLVIRMGVAIGEAGCIPPAHSLIAESFTRAERPRAVGIYTMGAPLSLVFGYFIAGWLNELYGWRMTFVIMGLPGLALAALAWATLREPRKTHRAPAPEQPPFGSVLGILWANLTFRHMLLCFAVSFFFNYGMLQWQPAFFIRSYHMGTGEIGSWFALSYGVCGLLGNYWGGVLATRYAAQNERLQLRVMAFLFAGYGAFSALVYLAPNKYLAFSALGLATASLTATNGPFLATVQTLVPAHLRAMSVAVLYFVANLVGMGLGPLAAGTLSDLLAPQFGAESLRYALLALCPGFLWCMWHLWCASESVRADLDGVRVSEVGDGNVVARS